MAHRNVCILGGTGFIGTQLCTELARGGYRVTVITRNAERARHLRVIPNVRLVSCNLADIDAIAQALTGHDAVVSLLGLPGKPGRDSARRGRAQVELTKRLVIACREAGIDRLLQMSRLGADASLGASHGLRAAGETERVVRDEGGPDLKWTLFRPSRIFGAGDRFTTRYARLLRRAPLALACPDARLAPVWVGDVVAAILLALENDDTAGECYRLCGPDTMTRRQVVEYLRDELGLRRRIIGLPDFAARLLGALLDWMPGRGFSTDHFRSLSVDWTCSGNDFARLGIVPHSLRSIAPQYLGIEGARSRYPRYRTRARR